MKKLQNKKWFSIVIAILLVILISLLAFLILEYMVPFSRNVKWIENSSKAYYLANSWIEDSLFFINRNNIWDEKHVDFPSSSVWISNHIVASWSLLPPVWQWNSEFDNSWNKISSGFPIQLDIWNNIVSNWWNVRFYFRVPDLDWKNWNNERLEGINPIINWQLSSEFDTLNSTWSWVDSSLINWSWIDFSFKDWVRLDGTLEDFPSFYDDTSHGCNSWSSKKCSLKLSIINNLNSNIESELVQVPYLEWKIDFDNDNSGINNVPLRYVIIDAAWKSYWFRKDLKIRIPQQSVIEAFDFTVFQ